VKFSAERADCTHMPAISVEFECPTDVPALREMKGRRSECFFDRYSASVRQKGEGGR
jgi:hypothetical protein